MSGTAGEFGYVETGAAEDWRPRLAGSALALVPVGLMALALSCIDPRYSVDAAGRALLTQRPGWLVSSLLCGALGVLITLAAVLPTRWRWRPYGSVVLVAFLVCFGQWGLGNMLSMRSHWISERLAVADSHGRTYRAGGDGDGEYWVVRDVEMRWDRIVVEIVAGDMSHSACLIRPTGEPPKPADASSLDVRVDAADRVYVFDGTDLLVAYDPLGNLHPPRWKNDDSPDFRRRGMTDAEISPFALLSATATGDDASIRRILKAISTARNRRADEHRNWVPSEAALLAAMDDPNPWVAETARTFVREGGATLYPTATGHLPR